MSSVDSIIKKMGYIHSDSLYYREDLKKTSLRLKLSLQTIRTLNELNPYAFYLIDNKPFVLFFEHVNNEEFLKSIHNKIWNSQTPVAIFDGEDQIEIYNGYSLNTEDGILHEIQQLDKNTLYDLSDFSFWNISSDDFWKEFVNPYSAPTIDTTMLDNIRVVINKMRRSSSDRFAVRLTLRLIFIRFLIDRGVDIDFKGFTGDPIKNQIYFLNILQSKGDLYNLFEHLKNKFNGNLFEFYNNDKNLEMSLLDEDILNELYYLMSGEIELEDGQLSLFPLYDFNIIPVELISNIYERLLGEARQKQDSAFYTPPHLVDYILKQTVKPHLKNNNTCTVLDPACGSGIFLVEALRAIIEKNLDGNKYFIDNTKLNTLLTEHIFGIDKNEEACDVAIFSLYITLLDYKDPKCLKDFKLPILKNTNFFVSDFFNPENSNYLSGKKFDFIIGNPPWGSVKGGLHKEYCKKRNIPNPNNEIANSFIARTKDFASRDTKCCLIVTSNLFYNSSGTAKEYRKWFLTETIVEKYIELAAVRKNIFHKAKGPAGIIFYNFNNESNKNNVLTHLTLKPNNFYRLFKKIIIETNDHKFIAQELLLKNDWAWKTIVYGTNHDLQNIKRLRKDYKTINNIIKEHDLSSGTGLRTDKGNKKTDHLKGKKLINSRKGISAFQVDFTYSEVFEQDNIASTRDKKIFEPPYALFKKGVNMNNYKLRAAYSEHEFLYKDAIYGISGDEKDEEILLSLVGILNSSFYAYLNLMLGRFVGIEREQALPTEVINYPTIIDETIANKARVIQNILEEMKKNPLSDRQDVQVKIKELDQYVLSAFGLQDDVFVDYALEVQIPLLTGDSSVSRQVSEKELRNYVQPFIRYWDGVLSDSNQGIEVIIYPSIKNRFTAIEVKFSTEEKITKKINISLENNTNIDLVTKFSLIKHNDLFYQIKDIINFQERSFYIVKTNEYKNWHPAISQLDLSKVIHSILLEGEDKDEWI